MVLFSVHRYFCSFGIRKLDKLFLRGGAPLYPIITAMYSIPFLTFMDPPLKNVLTLMINRNSQENALNKL